MKLYIKFFIFLLFLCTVFSGEVHLKDGSVLIGEIISQSDTSVTIKTTYGEQVIPLNEVENIIDSLNSEVKLKDGGKIIGEIIFQDAETVKIETKFGVQNIPMTEVSEIVYSKTSDKPKFKTTGLEDLGNAFLYSSQKKSVGVALGLEMLGGGLLYAEKNTAGAIMLLLENGLILSSLFVDDPDVATGLFVGSVVLKTINTIWTIKAVNDYNDALRNRIGMGGETEGISTVSSNYWSSFNPYLQKGNLLFSAEIGHAIDALTEMSYRIEYGLSSSIALRLEFAMISEYKRYSNTVKPINFWINLHPKELKSFNPYIMAGLTSIKLEISDHNFDFDYDSSRKLNFGFGVGVFKPLSERISAFIELKVNPFNGDDFIQYESMILSQDIDTDSNIYSIGLGISYSQNFKN
jgi:hypothetical protein